MMTTCSLLIQTLTPSLIRSLKHQANLGKSIHHSINCCQSSLFPSPFRPSITSIFLSSCFKQTNNLTHSSHLTEFASSGLDLPVSTISVSSSDISSVSILTSEATSNINLNNSTRSKRKRTLSDLDTEEEEEGRSQSESKVMRLDTS